MALTDTAGAHISTQTHADERVQKQDKCEGPCHLAAAVWSMVQCLDPLSALGCQEDNSCNPMKKENPDIFQKLQSSASLQGQSVK